MGKVLIDQKKNYVGLTRKVKAKNENLDKMRATLNVVIFSSIFSLYNSLKTNINNCDISSSENIDRSISFF